MSYESLLLFLLANQSKMAREHPHYPLIKRSWKGVLRASYFTE